MKVYFIQDNSFLRTAVHDRNRLLDIIRGVLMLIVVFGHSIQRCNGMDPSNPVHLIIQAFQMEALIFVSGYAFFCSKQISIKGKLIASIKRLLVPYLVWAVLGAMLIVLFAEGQFSVRWVSYELLTSGFWFLRVLFLIIALFTICFCLIKSKYASMVIFLLASWGMSFIPGQGKLFYYSLFFLAGAYLHIAFKYKLPNLSYNGRLVKCIEWCGANSLALYAVHWNLCFAYFPYRRLGLLQWLQGGGK